MQVILGANGQIGQELAKELHSKYNADLRLVSRSPKKVNESDRLLAANLLDSTMTSEAVKDAEIAYLTVGLPMNTKMWVEQWPIMMRNVIEACKKQGTKLVFFDNTYMYPQTATPQLEDTAFNPYGEKGKVRATIANMLLKEMESQTINAVICRSPEFYGPGKTQSITNKLIFENIQKGAKLKVFLRDDTLRTLIFTPDASKAMALIGNTPDAYGQTWHLPCDDNRLTYQQLIQLAGEIYGQTFSYSILKKWILQVVGLFNKQIKDAAELLPRYEKDNIFDSSKFKNYFPNFKVTSYREGIETIKNEVNTL